MEVSLLIEQWVEFLGGGAYLWNDFMSKINFKGLILKGFILVYVCIIGGLWWVGKSDWKVRKEKLRLFHGYCAKHHRFRGQVASLPVHLG